MRARRRLLYDERGMLLVELPSGQELLQIRQECDRRDTLDRLFRGRVGEKNLPCPVHFRGCGGRSRNVLRPIVSRHRKVRNHGWFVNTTAPHGSADRRKVLQTQGLRRIRSRRCPGSSSPPNRSPQTPAFTGRVATTGGTGRPFSKADPRCSIKETRVALSKGRS